MIIIRRCSKQVFEDPVKDPQGAPVLIKARRGTLIPGY